MSKCLEKISIWQLILITLLLKLPVFLAKHIQEDSFITWKVAQNLIDYGVIGFNGAEKMSASTTHLYVFVAAFFQLIFGDAFVYPILIFNSILFAFGSVFLAKILFANQNSKRNLFVILLNCTPPALAASCLGMEYGILFFLYCSLLYFGFLQRKTWALILFPILLLWTRLDTVIFLGVVFLIDVLRYRKINFKLVLGGILGVVSVFLFNYLYFGEWVNNTISAKKIAYEEFLSNNSFEFLLYQFAYYGGLIKKYGLLTTLIFLGFLVVLLCFIWDIWKSKEKRSTNVWFVVLGIAMFAIGKITVFAYFKAYFDWYYWLPRTFLFAIVLYWFIGFERLKKMSIPFAIVMVIGLYAFQLFQSFAIGYMETTQRLSIAKDLMQYQPSIKKSIMLEPAGKIPFYTKLYTYDEVGLVNHEVTEEMLKDRKYWWINSVKRIQPDFILTISEKADSGKLYYQMNADEKAYFDAHYQYVKAFPISDVHQNAPFYIKWIYDIRPIGKDYFLYIKKP